MSATGSAPIANRLLAELPRKQREQLLAQSAWVELEFGHALCEPERPYRNVYFPITAFISLVGAVTGHPPLELSLIGNEGMLGASLALGVAGAPQRAVVQGAGSAWRLSAAQLKQALRDSPTLVRVLHRYLYVLTAQLAQTTACSRFHEIEARLARWLLTTQDRAHADHFHLTHQFLAGMLGVQRSAVTISAGALQRRQLISYSRGEIIIENRAGLEAASCECYAADVGHYRLRFD